MGDLAHMTRASGLSAEIDATSVPLSAAARELVRRDDTALTSVLTGGDDYEILASVPPARFDAFKDEAREANIPLTVIGRIVEGMDAPRAIDGAGRSISMGRASHDHF